MEKNRPRGREKNVTGSGKSVYKRGEGLGSGPVGSSSGHSGRGDGGGRRGSAVTRGGAISLPVIIIAVLLFFMKGGLGGGSADSSYYGNSQTTSYSSYNYGDQLSSTGSASGNSSSSSGTGTTINTWTSGTAGNTGTLDTAVVSGAREKRTTILGGGKDTVTIMVYMCGTDLESRSAMATSDLQEMASANIGKNVNLLVYTGGCRSWRNNIVSSSTNQIYQVTGGGLKKLVSDDGAKPMVDPATLTSFIQFCAKNFQANRYELILWDHGGGSVSGYGYDEKFAARGAMSLPQINSALEKAGVAFDFIGFDACLMATTETALMLDKYADYMIASEETEPGIGWYYTDWLNKLSANTSISTTELGKSIIDSFVSACASKCRGQSTTLSIVDLAELSHTVPDKLTAFSDSISALIKDKQYQTVSAARNGAREFAKSTRIDQVDLVSLAERVGNSEGKALSEAIKGAVKYNRTSSNMTNAYGLSIYFPYQKMSTVSQAVSAYDQIGMNESYTRCIQDFASLQGAGQAASGSYGSPFESLLGGGNVSMDQDAIGQLLNSFLGGNYSMLEGMDSSNSGFFSNRAMPDAELTSYLQSNHFDASNLVWTEDADGSLQLQLTEDQWNLVNDLELNIFYDDGEGFIDLGLDNVFSFDEDGDLIADTSGTWLAINDQPVAYYHMDTVDDGEHYSITGRVPALLNGERVELILVFDSENPHGYIAGACSDYVNGETETVAKNMTEINDGDTIDFLCDYYSYKGEYQDSYMLGDQMVVDGELSISDVKLDPAAMQISYRFTDIYNANYWTEIINVK